MWYILCFIWNSTSLVAQFVHTNTTFVVFRLVLITCWDDVHLWFSTKNNEKCVIILYIQHYKKWDQLISLTLYTLCISHAKLLEFMWNLTIVLFCVHDTVDIHCIDVKFILKYFQIITVNNKYYHDLIIMVHVHVNILNCYLDRKMMSP